MDVFTHLEDQLSPKAKAALAAHCAAFDGGDPSLTVGELRTMIRRIFGEAVDAELEKHFAGRMVMHKGKMVERWSNQTDSGQNRLPPSAERWKARSKSYPGIAAAMAEQWGNPAELALTG